MHPPMHQARDWEHTQQLNNILFPDTPTCHSNFLGRSRPEFAILIDQYYPDENSFRTHVTLQPEEQYVPHQSNFPTMPYQEDKSADSNNHIYEILSIILQSGPPGDSVPQILQLYRFAATDARVSI